MCICIFLLSFFFFFFNIPFLHILAESMHLTGKYLDMVEKLTFALARIKNLVVENTSLKESVKKVTVESVEVRNENHLEKVKKVKKEVEEAITNFKASKEYSDRLMVEYADGFELPQKYFVKHHPNLNFS